MILEMSRKGELAHHAAAGAQLAAIREVTERASRVTFITHGPGMADPQKFGFEQSDDAHATLNAALGRMGKDARVALITHGGLAVPRVG